MTFNEARCTSPVLILTVGGAEANSAKLGRSRKEANTMDGVGIATALASHCAVMDLWLPSLICRQEDDMQCSKTCCGQ